MSKKAPRSPKLVKDSVNADRKGGEGVLEDEYNGETKQIDTTGPGPSLGTTDKHWLPLRLLKQAGKLPHGWGVMRFGPRDAAENANARAGKPVNWTGAEGNWKEGRLEGHGTYWFDNGDRYAGIFRDGKPGSIGTWWFANNDSYQGQCGVLRTTGDCGFSKMDATNLSREGHGTYWYSEKGGRYEGDFRKNERWGQGTMSYGDGGYYEGEWQKGERSGRGTMKYHDDERYEGQWQADKMHGRGVCFFTDGKVEFGNYVGGNRSGPAVRWSSDRKRAWRFMDGKHVDELDAAQLAANNLAPPPPHGAQDNANPTGLHCPHQHGVVNYAGGARYEGGLDNSLPEDQSGQARLVFASQVFYEGQFTQGQQHGNGREIHPNGSRYEGQFRAGRKDGEGTFWYHGGDQYHGNFKAGHREGLGTYWFPDGAVLISGYREGNPEGPGAWWGKRTPDGKREAAANTQDGALVQRTTLVAAAELAERLQFPNPGDETPVREQRRISLYPPGEPAPMPVAPAAVASTLESFILPGQEQTILFNNASLHSSLTTIDPRPPDGSQGPGQLVAPIELEAWEKGELVEAFAVLDGDGNGTLSAKDIPLLMHYAGQKEALASYVLQHYDRDESGSLTYDEVQGFMMWLKGYANRIFKKHETTFVVAQPLSKVVEIARQAEEEFHLPPGIFRSMLYDGDSDKNGLLDSAEFRKVLLGKPNKQIQGRRDMKLCHCTDSNKLEYDAEDDIAVFSAAHKLDQRSLLQRASQFKCDFGIELVWDKVPSSFSHSWDMSGSPCTDAHLARLLDRSDRLSLLNCIKTLPEVFRRKNILQRVVVCQALTMSGCTVGGLSGWNTIWLNADYIVGPCFRMTILHELYHVISQLDDSMNDGMDAEWRSLNPAGFVYLNEQGKVPARRNYDLSLRDGPIGFACGYGMTNVREDKATTLAKWMCQRAGVQKRIIDKQDGILREKVKIIQKELARCDQSFSLEYMGINELP